jgi:hypothetical protein
MSSRRKFIFDCSAFMAALAVDPISSFSQPATSGGGFQLLEHISYPELADQVNSIFQVRISAWQMVELKLLKAPFVPAAPVTSGKQFPGDAGYEKFSLIFRGHSRTLLPSAIHHFEHEKLGRFEMYIGQVGTTDNDDVRYEAGFNRPASVACSAKNLT